MRYVSLPFCAAALIIGALAHKAQARQCPTGAAESNLYAEIELSNIVSVILTTTPHLRSTKIVVDAAHGGFDVRVTRGPDGPVITASRKFVETLAAEERETVPYWAKVYWIAHELGHVQLNHDEFQRPCVNAGEK